MPANRARRTRVVLETASRHEVEQRPIIAVKIGGSLLTRPDLVHRVEWIFEQRPQARLVILCGGGATANTVRRWQAIHGIPDEAAHQLALAAMQFNEQLLCSAFAEARHVHSLQDLGEAWTSGIRPVLCASAFLDEIEAVEDAALPVGWSVTSDTIAAWCGGFAGASELILAKSTDLPPDMTLAEARSSGLVDEHFGTTGALPAQVTWVNLRSAQPRLTRWI